MIWSNIIKILQLKIFLDGTVLPVLPYNHCALKNVVECETNKRQKILDFEKGGLRCII